MRHVRRRHVMAAVRRLDYYLMRILRFGDSRGSSFFPVCAWFHDCERCDAVQHNNELAVVKGQINTRVLFGSDDPCTMCSIVFILCLQAPLPLIGNCNLFQQLYVRCYVELSARVLPFIVECNEAGVDGRFGGGRGAAGSFVLCVFVRLV